MNTIIGKILKFILIVLAVIFVLAMFLVAAEKLTGNKKEESKIESKTESVKIEEKEIEGTPYVILEDKISGDFREVVVEYSYFDSNKYLEEKQYLKEKYDKPEVAAYYFYPFDLIVEMLKEDVKKNKDTNYLSVMIKQKERSDEDNNVLMVVTIKKDEYLKEGIPLKNKDVNELNGSLLWLGYKVNRTGLTIGMQPKIREFYNELFGY